MPKEMTAEKQQAASQAAHEATEAWQRLTGERCVPERTELLKFKKKSAVFRLHGAGPEHSTIIAKRCVAATGRVEQRVYEEILVRIAEPKVRYLGFTPENGGQFVWLFLEDAGGQEYSPACAEHRALAGHWLAEVERAARETGAQAWLPDRGADHYLRQLNSARTTLLEQIPNPLLTDGEAAPMLAIALAFDRMEARWQEMEEVLAPPFRTLVHGDFVDKNLRLRNGSSPLSLLAFDWEMAGWGVPATDLAQELGHCASPDLEAYCAGLRENGSPPSVGDLRRIAAYGKLLRLLNSIFWTTCMLGSASRRCWIKPLRLFEIYQSQLSASLRAVGWS